MLGLLLTCSVNPREEAKPGTKDFRTQDSGGSRNACCTAGGEASGGGSALRPARVAPAGVCTRAQVARRGAHCPNTWHRQPLDGPDVQGSSLPDTQLSLQPEARAEHSWCTQHALPSPAVPTGPGTEPGSQDTPAGPLGWNSEGAGVTASGGSLDPPAFPPADHARFARGKACSKVGLHTSTVNARK